MNCLCRNSARFHVFCRSNGQLSSGTTTAITPPSSSGLFCYTLARRPYSDGPLTVRSRPVPAKKSNAADEIARTKFDLLDPITLEELPRAQQRFVRQFDKANRERVRHIFIKNKQMILWGWAMAFGCLCIYLYTMYALRKETYLEEIDEEVAIERGELVVDEHGNVVKPPES